MPRREASGLLYSILGQKAVVIDERDPLATGVLHIAQAGSCEALLPLGNHVQGNAIGPQILLHNSLRTSVQLLSTTSTLHVTVGGTRCIAIDVSVRSSRAALLCVQMIRSNEPVAIPGVRPFTGYTLLKSFLSFHPVHRAHRAGNCR